MKKGLMKAGACALSAALIMGLYAGPAFAEWVEAQNGAKTYVLDGKKLIGWHKIDGKWYFFNADGIMEIGWMEDENGDWYFLSPDGSMASGVVRVNGKVYYLGTPDSGKMEIGTVRINGRDYVFSENGDAVGSRIPTPEKAYNIVKNPDGTIKIVPEDVADSAYDHEDSSDDDTAPVAEAPTEIPSVEPSEAPSEEPSEAPSEEPTEAPSEVPTETPSADTTPQPQPTSGI